MTTAIQVLGGLLIAGGFVWMMWGAILILKEAYKVGPLWFFGCIMIPIVLALFVVKYPERVHAARMTILKSLIPFVLGIVLIAWLAPPSGKTAAKTEEKAAPAPAAVATPKPAVPAPKAGAPAPAAEPEPAASVIDLNLPDPAILAACKNEIGLYCNPVKDDARALKACLADYSDSLMTACKDAVQDHKP